MVYPYLLLAILVLFCHSCDSSRDSDQLDAQSQLSSNKHQAHDAAPAIDNQTINYLTEQAEHQFSIFKDYDLEASDQYAPSLQEMQQVYDFFDLARFKQKWNFFQKNYDQSGKTFGEDPAYDQDLIMKITSRASMLRTRSSLLTFEKVNLSDPAIVLDTVFVKRADFGDGFYDLHLRFSDPMGGVYELVNEACWLTDRGCINNLGWTYLGRYDVLQDSHFGSDMSTKSLDPEKESHLREKYKNQERKKLYWD